MFGTVSETPYDLRFSLFGIPVRVHPLFWLLSLVIGWVPDHLPFTVASVLCIFVSILVHELGHASTAAFFGWPPHIVLYWLGGYASYQPSWGHSTSRTILVLLAGPGAGFVLLGLTVGLEFALAFRGVELQPLAQHAMAELILINLAWGVMNLLPVYPLDGGQICRAALSHWRGSDGVEISLKLSLICAICVALLAYRFGQTTSAILFAALAFDNFQALHGARV
jgi:Zn-dependent protease